VLARSFECCWISKYSETIWKQKKEEERKKENIRPKYFLYNTRSELFIFLLVPTEIFRHLICLCGEEELDEV